MKDTASALTPLAGNLSHMLFSVIIIGTGFLIIPELNGAISQILSEAFNCKVGFSKPFKEAKKFYIIIVMIAMRLGVAIQLLGISSMKALLFTTVIYGLIAPVLIGITMHIRNSKKSWAAMAIRLFQRS